MMDENRFWEIIEQSRREKNSIDVNEQGDSLLSILQSLPEKSIVQFHARMLVLREQLKTPFMRDIAFMMKYGDNDTAFEGFVNWVIVLEKAHYYKALNSPPYLLTIEDPKLFVVNRPYFPDLSLVAPTAYLEKHDGDMTDWVRALMNLMRTEKNEE
jgi:hypothetical protein